MSESNKNTNDTEIKLCPHSETKVDLNDLSFLDKDNDISIKEEDQYAKLCADIREKYPDYTKKGDLCKRCGDYIVFLSKTKDTVTNEARKGVYCKKTAKFRASELLVTKIIMIPDLVEVDTVHHSWKDNTKIYKVGSIVREDNFFCTDINVVCAPGIHFFHSIEASVHYKDVKGFSGYSITYNDNGSKEYENYQKNNQDTPFYRNYIFRRGKEILLSEVGYFDNRIVKKTFNDDGSGVISVCDCANEYILLKKWDSRGRLIQGPVYECDDDFETDLLKVYRYEPRNNYNETKRQLIDKYIQFKNTFFCVTTVNPLILNIMKDSSGDVSMIIYSRYTSNGGSLIPEYRIVVGDDSNSQVPNKQVISWKPIKVFL